MNSILDWIAANKEWLFSGAGIVVLSIVLRALRHSFRRTRRALESIDFRALRDLVENTASGAFMVPRLFGLLTVQLNLYEGLFLRSLRVFLITDSCGRQIYESLVHEDPSRDLSDFWLLLLQRETLGRGRSLQEVLEEHAKLSQQELRRVVSQFIAARLEGSKEDVKQYLQYFPSIGEAYQKLQMNLADRERESIKLVKDFLHSDDSGPVGKRLREKLRQTPTSEQEGEEKAIHALAAAWRAYQGLGWEPTKVFEDWASMNGKDLNRLVGMLARERRTA